VKKHEIHYPGPARRVSSRCLKFETVGRTAAVTAGSILISWSGRKRMERQKGNLGCGTLCFPDRQAPSTIVDYRLSDGLSILIGPIP
jgi:hypothetical protein